MNKKKLVFHTLNTISRLTWRRQNIYKKILHGLYVNTDRLALPIQSSLGIARRIVSLL